MKRLFFYLLKKYNKTEADRVKIFQALDNGVYYEYNEQTTFGNVYNLFIEFVMANKFIRERTKSRDTESLKIIKRGIGNAFNEAIDIIESEKLA